MAASTYNDLRRGIYQRIGALDNAKSIIEELEQSLFSGVKGYELEDWQSEKSLEGNFLKTVREDYNIKITEWKKLLQKEDWVLEMRTTPQIFISPKLDVNASITTQKHWLLKWRDIAPKIELNLGLILAVEDLISYGLCTKTFYTFRTPTGELNLPNPFFKIGSEHSSRFLDYKYVIENSKQQAQMLTASIPISPWRLYQLDLLSEIAVQWAMLHEQSHWLLGHLGYLKSKSKKKSALSLNENTRTPSLLSIKESDWYKYFEMEADALATSLLFNLNFLPKGGSYRIRVKTCHRESWINSASGITFQLLFF